MRDLVNVTAQKKLAINMCIYACIITYQDDFKSSLISNHDCQDIMKL
jgi:hypothetical protein